MPPRVSGRYPVIELAALRSPDLLTQTVVDGLALANRDMHASPTENTIIEYLRTRRMLLIFDNCEHLLDECAQLVSVLLRSTTELRIITTSREILSVPDEFVFPLSPLPTVIGTESAFPSRGTGSTVELFVNRVAAVLPKFKLTERNRDAVMCVPTRLSCAQQPRRVVGPVGSIRVPKVHVVGRESGRGWRALWKPQSRIW
jgi:predicted ATPase